MVLYTTMLKGSRKLEALKENPKVGFYVGPRKPTRWLQGTGRAVEARDAEVIAKGTAIVLEQAPDASMFIDRVPVSVVRIFVDQVQLTDIAGPYKAELNVRRFA